jgi:NAD(P)-dependent dehydrogenase (short-subunit alcohol dehydrogenase family)
VLTARGADDLERVRAELAALTRVVAVAGDVADPAHRQRLAEVTAKLGGIDVLVNNASLLGPSPQPSLASYELDAFRRVFEIDVIAPLALVQLLLPSLRRSRGTVVNISSDAAVEAYAGWGGYGSAKAALDQLTAILAQEEPEVRCFAFDPGDMRTEMQQQAFPGEDISDRPEPETVAPALLRLLSSDRPSGRYRAAQLLPIEAPA